MRAGVAVVGGLVILVGAGFLLIGEPQGEAAGPVPDPASSGVHSVASVEDACLAEAGGKVDDSTTYLDGTAIVLGTGATGGPWVCDAVVAGSSWTVRVHQAH